jgi:Tol biopolymer transport system component
MKKPLALLLGIVAAIVLLSLMFPSDPGKPDIITIIKNWTGKVKEPPKDTEGYRVGELFRVDSPGKALIWSYDEMNIYYSKPVEGDKNGREELWVSDIKGNRKKIETSDKLYNIGSAKWDSSGSLLAFTSTIGDKSSLFIYNIADGSMKNITPPNIKGEGITSYDWDDQSMYLIMTVDIASPRIYLYNIKTQKLSRLDMKLNYCMDAAFGGNNTIVYSDRNEEDQYIIYRADITGKNQVPIAEGQGFKISPDRKKLAILTDGNLQDGLWIYDIASTKRTLLYSWPVYDVYWVSGSDSLMYSTIEDCNSEEGYTGTIYYVGRDSKEVSIKGVVYPIFASSRDGARIAMTSPQYISGNEENKGVFIGVLYK